MQKKSTITIFLTGLSIVLILAAAGIALLSGFTHNNSNNTITENYQNNPFN